MTNSQYIDTVTFEGAPSDTNLDDLAPGASGVNFDSINASIIIPFPPTITPIIVSVSVPDMNTNVNQIIVVIRDENGVVLVSETSPFGTNKVTEFPLEPLPESSTLTVILLTPDERAPQNVTLSVIACYTPSTGATIVTTGSTPPTVTGETSTLIISSETTTVSTGYTTTVICPLTEGMNNPQYINNVTIIGAVDGTEPSDLNPGQPGVDFTSQNPSISISFPSDITPIIVNVSVPNTNTNVVEIIVTITAPDGTVLFNQTSPPGTNSVTGFPVEPLPEGSTLIVIPVTVDGSAPENVTLSVIACYTPSTAATVVSTGTVPPTIVSTTGTIAISTTTSEETGPSSTPATSETGSSTFVTGTTVQYTGIH